jgi:putative inorganic carbon (hco3(-)) transporter
MPGIAILNESVSRLMRMNDPLKLAFYAALLFLLTVPWILTAIPGPQYHDGARLAQLFLAWLVSLALVASRGQAFTLWWPRLKRLQCLVLMAIALAAGSVLTAPSWLGAFKELMLWLSFFLTALLIHSQALKEKNFKRLSQVIAIALMFGSLQCVLAGISMMIGSGKLEPDMVAMGYDNYRFLNHMQTVALPLACLVLLPTFQAQPWLKKLAYAGLAMAWTLLLLTLGRATLLGLLVGGLCLGLFFGLRAWVVLRPLLVSLLMGCVLFGLLFVLLPWLLGIPSAWNGAQHLREGTDSGRFYLWTIAWDMFLAHPWLGSGPMQFANHATYVQYMPHPWVAHPHNVYLQGLAEWGAPLTLLGLALAGRLVWRLYQRTRAAGLSRPDQAAFERGQLLLFTLVAALTDAALSGNFVMPVAMVWLAVAMGLAGARTQESDCSEVPGQSLPQNGHWVMAWVLFSMLTALAYWLLPDVMDQSAAKFASEASLPMSPRFWLYGWWR